VERQELIEKIKRLPHDQVAAVQNFVDSLIRRDLGPDRAQLHRELTDYARKHAGTNADIDLELETAAADHLTQQDSE